MTTQRDLDVVADANRQRNDMRICDKCGWYMLMNHADQCKPALGRMAQQLIASVPNVRSGQLGYGDGQVVFDLADDFSIRFEIGRAGTRGRAFSLRDVHRLGSLTAAEAAELVSVIKTWADAVAAKRDSAG